ncbi:AAA family ATPase [Streptomyces avermitilis]
MDRQAERREIGRLLQSAAEGLGQSLIFQGEAGTGKSALLREAAVRARADGFRVMLAQGSSVEHDVPLGLVRRLFDSVMTFLPEAEQDVLVRILDRIPEDAGGAADGPAAGADVVRRTLHLVLRKLLRSDTAVPVLVVVDNLHWADRESLEWLVTLPEHIVSLPVALLASVCDGVPSTDLALLDQILVLSSRQVTLRGLGAASASILLREQLGRVPEQAFVSGVMQVTGGNPQLLTALTQWLVREGTHPDAEAADGLGTIVLDSLTRSLDVRLRYVSPHALTVLRAVAVLDNETTLQRVCAIVGCDPSEIVDVIGRLRHLGILTERRGRPRVSHALVRNAVLAEDAQGTLREIHARTARLLRDDPGAQHSVCHHLILSGPVGEAWVPRVLRAAARCAADASTAMSFLRRALAEPLPTDVRAQVLFELAAAAGSTDLTAAVSYLNEGWSLTGPECSLTRVPADLIDVLILGGREREVARLVAPGGEGFNERRDAIDCRLSLLSALTPVDADAVRRLRELEPEGALTSAVQAGWEADRGRDRTAAVEGAEQVLKMAVAGAEDLVARLKACWVLTAADQAEEAASRCDETLDMARRRGDRFLTSFALACKASILRVTGDLRAAEAAARESMRELMSCRVSRRSPVLLGLLATHIEILVDLGRGREAMTLLDRLEPIEERPRGRTAAYSLFVRGRLRRQLGQPIGGLKDLMASGEWFTVAGITNPAVVDWRAESALVLHELGEVSRARALAADALNTAELWGTPAAMGRSLRIMGRVGAGQGAARDLLESSVNLLRTSAEKVSLAESLTDLGGQLVQQGDKPSAREFLRQAHALAEAAGCAELIGRSRALLSASGGRPRRSAKAGTSSLTESERKVAELAALSKTNKAIAARLFVAQRTVEIHLTNVYRKLGIEGRAQLREALRGADDTPAALAV